MFLGLRCAPDVLGVCGPMKGASKEITEAVAVTSRVRKWALKNPMQYSMLDLCAGNALSSVLGVMYLPLKDAIAVDKKARKRNWDKVDRFDYITMDIYDKNIFDMIDEQTIITSIHPCKRAAMRVVEIFNNSDAPYLIMVPCCVQRDSINRERLPTIIREKFGTHEQWSYFLSTKIEGAEVNIMQDHYCLSPRNIVITAVRKETSNEKTS